MDIYTNRAENREAVTSDTVTSDAVTSDAVTSDTGLVDTFCDVLSRESAALERFRSSIPRDHIIRVLKCLAACRGKIVVIGVGKSGLVGRKISATLSSTGSPSVYLSAADCAHGDMGAICADDVVLLISNSGRTSEILALLPYFEEHAIPIVTLIGESGSPLQEVSPYTLVLDGVPEADGYGIVPSCSTTVMLAIGDALAIALMTYKGVTDQRFAKWHPGGWLGRQLATKVKHLVHGPKLCPLVDADQSLKDVLPLMTQFHVGVLVSELSAREYGVFTDGDLRRALESGKSALDKPLAHFLQKDPLCIDLEARAQDALSIMESKKITQLVVVDAHHVYAGVIHIHSLLEFRES